jgi:transposase
MYVESHVPLAELKRLERAERDAGCARRLRIIILAMEGYTAPAVAMSVGRSRRVCQQWVQRYNAEGLAGLEDRRGQESHELLTPDQAQQMCRRLDAGPLPEDRVCSLRGRDVQRILAEEFGVLRSLARVYALLHHWGYSCLRPRPRHRKADPKRQEAFRREFPDRLQQIAAAHPGRRLRIFFQDESRFGQQGTTTNVWASKGSRPTAIRQTEYEYLWVLGAVCPADGQAEGLLSPRLNTDVVNGTSPLYELVLASGG